MRTPCQSPSPGTFQVLNASGAFAPPATRVQPAAASCCAKNDSSSAAVLGVVARASDCWRGPPKLDPEDCSSTPSGARSAGRRCVGMPGGGPPFCAQGEPTNCCALADCAGSKWSRTSFAALGRANTVNETYGSPSPLQNMLPFVGPTDPWNPPGCTCWGTGGGVSPFFASSRS